MIATDGSRRLSPTNSLLGIPGARQTAGSLGLVPAVDRHVLPDSLTVILMLARKLARRPGVGRMSYSSHHFARSEVVSRACLVPVAVAMPMKSGLSRSPFSLSKKGSATTTRTS
jgi:hypothetical protein